MILLKYKDQMVILIYKYSRNINHFISLINSKVDFKSLKSILLTKIKSEYNGLNRREIC